MAALLLLRMGTDWCYASVTPNEAHRLALWQSGEINMGILRSIFGPSKDEIWAQVATDIGAEFTDGGYWGQDELRYTAGQWEILLDTYVVSSGQSSTSYTRLRVPFVNKDGFYFKIYNESIFSSIGKFFGMQDIVIGDNFFDDAYVIKSNKEDQVRLLLADERLKDLIRAQPYVSLNIKDDEGYFGKTYPQGVDVLEFTCVGVLKDPDRIKDLFDLFVCILERLVQIDSAYEDDPQLRL